jgi:Protein of unknown function DUF262/Protein of unknown function (DUF1524)
MRLQPVYDTLDELLQRRLFRIPDYQRAYSWNAKQRNDLFDDITKILDRNDDRHHFMATIVCLKKPGKEEVGTQEFRMLDVVDGQQRLTTLIILLKAISKDLKEGEGADKEEAAQIDKLLLKDQGRLILLQTNHDSSMIFSDYIRNGTLPDEDKITTQADYKLSQAFLHCERFVQQTDDSLHLLKVVKNRLGFIFHELQDEGAVYTVFEVLNSRGLDVDWLDKCKTMLMGLAFEGAGQGAHDLIAELHGYWKQVYRTIGLTKMNGSEILTFAATLRQPNVPRRKVSDEVAVDYFRTFCADEPKRITDSTRWLHDVAVKLVQLQKDPRRRSVTIITQARLLACAILLTDSLTQEEKDKALEQWERVTFRIYGLYDKDSRTLVGDYTSLAHRVLNKDIRNCTQLMSQLRELGKKHPIDDAVECVRSKRNCYEDWETHAKYMLCRYEEYLAKEYGAVIQSDMWQQIWSASPARTIEHIYPVTPGKGWNRMGFRHGDEVHRLGNLMLLPPGVNSAAGNKSFAEKKSIYKKNFIRMMDDVLAEDDWNKDAMVHREDKMLAWAKQQWDDISP